MRLELLVLFHMGFQATMGKGCIYYTFCINYLIKSSKGLDLAYSLQTNPS